MIRLSIASSLHAAAVAVSNIADSVTRSFYAIETSIEDKAIQEAHRYANKLVDVEGKVVARAHEVLDNIRVELEEAEVEAKTLRNAFAEKVDQFVTQRDATIDKILNRTNA